MVTYAAASRAGGVCSGAVMKMAPDVLSIRGHCVWPLTLITERNLDAV